ncbi:hypothetical protein [Hyphococcus sp.]|uniref:hypothetical protein n=1 Tax=Hyphococcus sp. TaxID=2038636 RepID=UPI003CCBA990
MKNSANIKILARFIAVSGALAPLQLQAQPPTPPAPKVLAAMEKLSWLEGEWRGDGWRMGPDGKETFSVTETAEYVLDGMVLTLHGRGWSEDEDGNEVEGHKAFGVMSYDAYAQRYHFDAFVKEGYQSRSTPQIGENDYRWSHTGGPGVEMRYYARLNDEGQWIETGERCEGDNCTQVFEMRLSKAE